LSSDYTIYGSDFRFLRILRKKLNQFQSRKNHLQSDLDTLLEDGFFRMANTIGMETIEQWKNDYGIKKENFEPRDGNLGFPFYNEEMHRLITNSRIKNLLFDFFSTIYGKTPVLQIIPHLVIAYPNISHQDFSPDKNNFPAAMHVDYPYEFTIHIPLTKITDLTSHTKYISGSHLFFSTPSYRNRNLQSQKLVSCYANPGDVLFLDVDGWHRAELVKTSFRAIIQLKFSAGNNLLFFQKTDKLVKNNQRTMDAMKTFPSLKKKLTEDRTFLQNLDVSSSKSIGILKDNIGYYEPFLAT